MREAVDSLSSDPLRNTRNESTVETELELRYLLCSKRYRIVFHVVGEQVNVIDIQELKSQAHHHF
jgi:hypothetical protein